MLKNWGNGRRTRDAWRMWSKVDVMEKASAVVASWACRGRVKVYMLKKIDDTEVGGVATDRKKGRFDRVLTENFNGLEAKSSGVRRKVYLAMLANCAVVVSFDGEFVQGV